MIWSELKEFVNSLTEQQLKEKVVLWQEENAITKIKTMILSEDQYVDDSDFSAGCFGLSEGRMTAEDVKREGLRKVYDKGCPILWEDF